MSQTGSTSRAGAWAWLAALMAWVTLALIAAASLWLQRNEAVGAQQRELSLLSLALTDELERGLRGVEDGLLTLRAEFIDGRLLLHSPFVANELTSRARLMPMVNILWVVDESWQTLVASDPVALAGKELFLPPLADLGDSDRSFSEPVTDPTTGLPMIAMALRVRNPISPLNGWVVAGLPAEMLRGAFAVASPAIDAHMAVVRDDGEPLAGSILEGGGLSRAERVQRMRDWPEVAVRHLDDGSNRIVSVRALPRYRLKVVLTRDLDAALRSWENSVGLTAAGLGLLLLGGLASSYFLHRAEQRRAAAQSALMAQSVRASRLEAIGALAGGVAHDFNNVLAGIIGYGELAQDLSARGSAQSRHLEKLMQGAFRGKALVERILTFSRGGAHENKVFELNPVVDEVLTLMSGSLPAGIVLERKTDATAGRVRGDPTRAFEAVMNLCTNAIQALPEGGTVFISLARHQAAESRPLSHAQLLAGRYLQLSVSDTGIGMTPEVMDHLFEPFFTTRAGVSGTGLGLAVVHGVMSEFNGVIDVQSQPGKGAQFTLYFPECDEPLSMGEERRTDAPAGQGQAILVVDDDATLMKLTEAILIELGYAPTGFTDPAEALAAVRAAPQRFAAVITDEVMPTLSGTALGAALRADGAMLPILLVSGYGGPQLSQRALAVGVSKVLAKPLRRATLARALSELLS